MAGGRVGAALQGVLVLGLAATVTSLAYENSGRATPQGFAQNPPLAEQLGEQPKSEPAPEPVKATLQPDQAPEQTKPVAEVAPQPGGNSIIRSAGTQSQPQTRTVAQQPEPVRNSADFGKTPAVRPEQSQPKPETASLQKPKEEATKAAPPNPGEGEIAGPVPQANIIIYLKSRAVMLRSHAVILRVYKGAAVPGNLSGPKTAAADGKAPLGKYYVCAAEVGESGPALLLSYPAPEDAARAQTAGLIDAEQYKEIIAAAEVRAAPPQDTPMGGGVRIIGGSVAGGKTESGFVIGPGQMEELYRAAPAGTPVVIVNR